MMYVLKTKRALWKQLVSAAMAPIVLMATMPVSPVFAKTKPLASPVVKRQEAPIHVKTGSHKLTKIVPTLSFSKDPTDLELKTARVFSEPLAPMSGSVLPDENGALASALLSFKKKNDREDLSDLAQFIASFPNSRWRPALELNMGNLKHQAGYFTDAQSLWQSAWEKAKAERGRDRFAVANRAVANLVKLDMRLGKTEELETLLKEVDKRAFFGSDEEAVIGARTGLWLQTNEPERAFKCGPYSIDSILNLHNQVKGTSDFVKNLSSTKKGTNLAQVKKWANEAGLKYQAAKRSPGAPVVVPSIMHLKVGHFAAIAEKVGNNYLLKDPTFDTGMTVGLSDKALESQSDGYFLVADGKLPSGWQAVSDEEASTVWGKGGTTMPNNNQHTCTKKVCCITNCSGGKACGSTCGMADAAAWALQATLHIIDTPVSYHPPVGPDIKCTITYNHQETNQPGTFTFSNLGQDWLFNWLSYMTVDSMTSVATVRVRGGGSEVYTPSMGSYPPDVLTQAVLVSLGSGNYQRQLKDGTVELFNLTDGSGNVFMTQVTDPQGNSAVIDYDGHYRLTTITDALNQVTTVSYVSNTYGNSGFYVIASITDPFGRSASFTYDSTNSFLLSITDCIGLTSSFNYDTSSSFISMMTTPYGTTSFQKYVPGNNGYPAIGLRFTYPDGTSSVIENWAHFTNTSYYWDREATQLYPNDPAQQNYTHCIVTKWLEEATPELESAIPYTVTNPLESQSPITYSYAGQINPVYEGTINKPTLITRSLNDESFIATIGGTITAGNTVTIAADTTLGLNYFTYTVLSGDTTSSIAQALAGLMNASSNMQTLHLVCAAVGNTVIMNAQSATAEFYGLTSYAATETIIVNSQVRQTETITVLGPIVSGDTVYLIVDYPYVRYVGPYSVTGADTTTTVATNLAAAVNADTTLQAVPITATSSDANIYITSYGPTDTAYNYYSIHTAMSFGPVCNGSTQNWQYQYNSLANVTQSIDPNGRKFTYTYAGNEIDLTQITETQGSDDYQIGAWTYDSYHRPLTYTDGSGQVTTYTYNSSEELLTVTDANSDVTTLTYTGTGSATIGGTKTTGDVVTLEAHDAGLSGGHESVNYTVLSGDNLTSIAAALASAINADTNLQAIGVSATSASTTITLTSNSTNVTSYTESTSGGATETITLGATNFGYLTKIDGPLSGSDDVTTFAYDSVGRLASTTDSEGYTLSYSYDNADRLTQTAYPDGTTEQIVYDRLDAVLKTDRIGRTTQDSYDELDRLTYEIDPLGRKTQYQWCICGALAALTDPNGNTTTWQHDLQGRTVSKTYADQTKVTYRYEDYIGRLRSKTDALGQTTNYLYGIDNTPFMVSYSNAVNATAPVVYTWDNNFRRLTSIQKPDWGTNSYTYNAYIVPSGSPTTGGGMLATATNNVIANSDISYSYDVLGRTTNRSINGGSNSTTWTYDAMSRITAEANPLGTFDYAYVDNVSGSSKGTLRLASITYPNSQVTNFNWYPNVGDQRLKTISNLNPSGATLSQFDYAYDPAGEITLWQQQQNGNNLFYNLGYDQAGQLISAQAGAGAPQPPYAKENYYSYDAGANRTAVQSASLDTVRVGGSKTTGDVLTISVKDPALSGGQEAVNYTVLSGDNLSSIALALATAINKDTNLQTLGVVANGHGSNTFVNIRSISQNITTYTPSTSGGATETLNFGIFENGRENATIGGSKTTGDVLTITVHDPALSGGQEAVNYTTLSGDTLSSITTALKSAINADSSLSALGVTATVASDVITISSASTNATTYSESVSSGATETISLAANTNVNAIAEIGGSKTTGDVLTLTIYDALLGGGSHAVSYTTLSGDTLTSIATALTSAVNGDSDLQAIGVSASSSGKMITIQSNSPNSTTYRQTFSSGATESIAITTPTFGWQEATIGGSKTTGDVLTLTVYDSDLSGGKEAVSYTTLSGDTLSSIASSLASAINADTNLQAINVSAAASSTVVSIESLSPNLTTYTQSTSSGATETIALGTTSGVAEAAFNNVNELIGLSSGGAARFQGTSDKPVQSAVLNSQVVGITSTPSQAASSTISASATSTGSETLTFVDNGAGYVNGESTQLTIGGTAHAGDLISITVYEVRLAGGSHTVQYVVQPGDSTTSIAVALQSIINADSAFSPFIAYVFSQSANVILIADISQTATGHNSEAFVGSVTGSATETVSLAYNSDQNYIVTIGGTITAGDVVSATVQNAALPGGQETAVYTVMSGDSLTSVATGLKSAINSDTNLQALGIGATSSSAVVSILSDTYFTTSTSGGATETMTLGTNNRGNVSITVGGSATTGDTLSVEAHNQTLSGGTQSVTYTVLSTDNLLSISNGIAAAINANSNLQNLGVTVPTNSAALAFAQSFSGNSQLPTAASTASATVTDGGSNVKTNGINLSVATGTSSSLTYDLNGNMTSDGNGNSYSWDAENRLLQITYPGSGNNSQFSYDGMGRNVVIQEYTASSLTSTKQFVWASDKMRKYQPCEARNAGSTITAQYFRLGETISGTSYFYNKGQWDIREMTNSSGTVKAEYAYNPFGQVTKISEAVPSDFGYAGYYVHARSGLNLTRSRAYNTSLGRFISRDDIAEDGGVNLFVYLKNNPISLADPSGEGSLATPPSPSQSEAQAQAILCSCRRQCQWQFADVYIMLKNLGIIDLGYDEYMTTCIKDCIDSKDPFKSRQWMQNPPDMPPRNYWPWNQPEQVDLPPGFTEPS